MMRMLLKYSILVMLTCSGNFLSAQIMLGLKAGSNISNERHKIVQHPYFNYGESYFHNNVFKALGGFFCEYSVNKNISLESSVQYIGMGYDSKFPQFYYVKDKTDYDYLHIPVSFKYYLDEKLSVQAGPYISYLLKAKKNNEADIKDYRKALDAGLQCGPEFKIFKNIGLGARYSLGLVDTDNSVNGQNFKRFNRGLQLYTFLMLTQTKKQ